MEYPNHEIFSSIKDQEMNGTIRTTNRELNNILGKYKAEIEDEIRAEKKHQPVNHSRRQNHNKSESNSKQSAYKISRFESPLSRKSNHVLRDRNQSDKLPGAYLHDYSSSQMTSNLKASKFKSLNKLGMATRNNKEMDSNLVDPVHAQNEKFRNSEIPQNILTRKYESEKSMFVKKPNHGNQ